MKLKYLKVDGYKNLNNIEIYFNKDSSVCALIGNNGSGKSNVLEVITRIFGSVYAEIEDIGGPITFHLKNPGWSRRAVITEQSFWNAKGSSEYLLHRIKDYGKLEIENNNCATIIIEHISDLKEIWECESECDLFVKCKLLSQEGLLEEIELYAIKDGKEIKLEELSEGEKQLAELLCILDATREYKALFLLDEFDSYLHPSWQRKFATILGEIEIRGQVIFTTHSPLTLGKMQNDNIVMLKDGGVYMPSANTFNRDISEVLTEVMDVDTRPSDVEGAIRDFRRAVMKKDRKDVEVQLEQLRALLSSDDPFWVTVEHMLARLER